MPRFVLGCALALFVFASGCATKPYSSVPQSRAGPVKSVDSGVVVSVNHIVFDGYPTMLGVSSGAVVGSAIGQSVGQGSGRVLSTAAGAVVGMAAGAQLERDMNTQIVQEMTVRLDDGTLVAVTQELVEPGFIEGDLVIVTRTHYGHAYVKHAHLDE